MYNTQNNVTIHFRPDQVFLGMAASFVPPKRDIVALIEDVEAAGVRFVYFSPRNMRRSKVWGRLDVFGLSQGREYNPLYHNSFPAGSVMRDTCNHRLQ